MSTPKHTSVAVLGTLAEFHQEPIPYDMAALVKLVARINPDLLCLDMTKEQWATKDFGGLPKEYSKALIPLAHQTDIVVSPIAGRQPPPVPQAQGWRGMVISWLRDRIATIQRTAPGPDAVNQGWRHHLANIFYGLTRRLSGREVEKAWQEHTDHLTQAVQSVACHDPGSRVLVVVNVQHCHIIRERLRAYKGIEVKNYAAL